MCGRYNVVNNLYTQLMMKILGIQFDNPCDFKSQYNIAPTEFAPIILANNDHFELRSARWWLVPSWAKEPSTQFKMFNARAETIESSKAYKKPFNEQRCIVPASGWYEWRKENGGKTPYYVTGNEQGLAFAGVYDEWQQGESPLTSFSVITTDAAPDLEFLHHRMPLLLKEDQFEDWLSGTTNIEDIRAMLTTQVPNELEVKKADRTMNNAADKSQDFVVASEAGKTIPPYSVMA